MTELSENTLASDAVPLEFDPIEAEKREWLAKVPIEDADDVLFHFETSIKALDRFFNVANHPRRRSGSISIDHDLRVEILVADRCLRSLLQQCESVLDETDTSAFVFRSYVETQLVSDVERDALLDRHQQQNSPLESLYLLQIGVRSLAQLSSGLLNADHVSLNAFCALGHQYTSLIIQNRYFNPLRNRVFNPIYDRVEHPILQNVVKQTGSERLRRGLSFIILVLNRYHRIVNWVRPGAPTRNELYDGLPWLALLRSDFRTLIPYLETTFPKRLCPNGPENEGEREFLSRIDAFAFQLGMETQKVFEQLLLDFSQKTDMNSLRSGLEAAHGLLNAFLQQSIVNFVQTGMPDAEGKDVFSDFVSRLEQSKRLREDIWVFHELLRVFIRLLSDDETYPANRRDVYEALLQYLTYFLDLTFKLVRAGDHETFANFISNIQALEKESFENTNRNREVARTVEHFRIFLETTLGHINQRVDLQDEPLDEQHAQAMLKNFLPERYYEA